MIQQHESNIHIGVLTLTCPIPAVLRKASGADVGNDSLKTMALPMNPMEHLQYMYILTDIANLPQAGRWVVAGVGYQSTR